MPNGDEKKVLKQFAAKTETDTDERTVTAIISTIGVDRENEVLLPKGMDYAAYMKNPVVLWAHDYHSEPIARTLWMKKGRKEIKAKIKFAETEQAEQVYQLFKGGFMNAFSVGFIPIETHEPTETEIKDKPEWGDVRKIYDKWELLEFSPVPVPANPEALAVAVKAKELNLSDELIEQLDIDDSVIIYADTATDVKQKYECECIKCGHKLTSDKHCKDLKCPKCGGQMRRVERPGPGQEDVDEDAVLRPYPNEHACRLKPPNYDSYARKSCAQKHDGKCIDVIYGIKAGKSEIQALRFGKKIWTAGAAKSVCKERGGTFEAAKIQVRARPKLRKHSIIKCSYDPNEIRAMAEAQIRGEVYFNK